MKGYLKGVDGGLFQLAPKVTTIGREGCDLTVQTSGVDYQHAVIEFSDQEQCFVLQDLNTVQGTYVNDCRVQNAAVRLAPGDIIRFGSSNSSFELEVENPAQVSYPPVHQRAAWSAPLTVITDSRPPTVYNNEALPHLVSASKHTPPPAWSSSVGGGTMPPPRPPPATMRSRPLSAGSVTTKVRLADRGTSQAGWVNTGGTSRGMMNGMTAQDSISVLQEKEQKLLRMQEEVRRLSLYEGECNRKEELIQTLREEIADLQGRLRQMETSRSVIAAGGSEAEVIEKLDGELQQKRLEVNSLKEQINRMKSGGGDGSSGQVSREDFNTRIMEVNSLRNELERIKKDKNLTSGLVTQMQRDMANKDTSISRLTREMENIKKEVKEKDTQLLAMQTKRSRDDTHSPVRTYRTDRKSAMNSAPTTYYLSQTKPHQVNLAKFKRVDDNRKFDEELDAKEKEVASLRLTNKAMENRLQEQSDLIASLKNEMERMRKDSEDSREVKKKLSSDLDAARSNCLDLERAERQVRVDLQQSKVKMDRLHDRVLQVTFSTPGIKAPSEPLDDDQLVNALKKVVGERTDLYKQVKELKDSLQLANSVKREVTDNTKKLKQQLNESTSRLRLKGFSCGQLKQEVDLVSAVSLSEGVTWMRDMVVDLLKSMLAWQFDIEQVLEASGINVKISDQSTAEHVQYMRLRLHDLKEEKERLEQMLETLKHTSKDDLESTVTQLREELSNKCRDEVEKAKLEAEETFNKRIEEIRLLEEERRENALQGERVKVTELEVSLAQLKASIIDKEDEHKENREAAHHALEELEVIKKSESELKEKVYRLELEVEESRGREKTAIQGATANYEKEYASFQQQVKQHSVTICTLEERLNKVLQKNRDYAAEVTQLKTTIQELKTLKPKPPTGPKPKLLAQKSQDMAALEQVVAQLRKENVDFKKTISEQQTVISGLRRDLEGASAKLSDMTGELTEKQKEKMEQDRLVLQKKDSELMESRTNLAKLSTIVDNQTSELKTLKDDLSKHKTLLAKFKNIVNEKETMVTSLEEKLRKEQEEQKSRLDLLQEEGRITSELTALGAQCRGERHEQVINRQREALTELRFRIKALEQCGSSANTPGPSNVPTHDQALQQVMLLKKELAELRAKESLSETRMITDTMTDRSIQRARGLSPEGVAEQSSAEVERSAHRETMESLEYSENTYLSLLRVISGALEMDDVAGLRSMAHIPNDERHRLFAEREQACELLASRIKVLKERVQRKDELLQGYEKDLAKLRQAEVLADHRATQLEDLSSDVRGRTEETQYLREALQRTRERLEQEKRLNSAIKAKKTFHLDYKNQDHLRSQKPHCEAEDIFGKKDQKKKERVEKTKKKNYEIKVLKAELSQRDQDLTKARKSLLAIQSTGAHGARISRSTPRLSPSSTTSPRSPSPVSVSITSPSSVEAALKNMHHDSGPNHLMFKSSPNLGLFKDFEDTSGELGSPEDETNLSGETKDKTFSAVSSSVLSHSVLESNA